MKREVLKARMRQCLELAKLSPCKRRQFGAMILDPSSLSIISDGYNGTPRNGPEQCLDDRICARTSLSIESGTRLEIGCIHAEQNALMNALRTGARTMNCFIIVNGAPCLQCAKLIYHAGLTRIYILDGQYPKEAGGLSFLKQYGIDIEIINPNDL